MIANAMRVLVVGMNPSKTKRGMKSPTLRNLAEWQDRLGLKYVCFHNVYGLPGNFSDKEVDLEDLYRITKGYDRILALGSRVSKILDRAKIKHFKLPHPSGLNRQLNDPKYVNWCLGKCYNYLK